MLHSFRNVFLGLGRSLASATLMFFALPWLMVLLVLGTVAQRYIGLYASQKLFFGSFLLWAGVVPLPGAYSVLALISASLIAKLLFKSVLSWRRAGTLLIHVSAIVLLLGGLLSTLYREDGYVLLADGESASTVRDYRQLSLTVKKNDAMMAALPMNKLQPGNVLAENALPFQVTLLDYCYPCTVKARVQQAPGENFRGVAAKLELSKVALSPEESRNLHGALFKVSGASATQDGVYMAYDTLARPAQILLGKDSYAIILQVAERPLPFNVKLQHFTKSDYPGTDEARAYRSEVTVADGALAWNTVIEMNQPLRYKGYTLYQSSFVEDGGRLLTVLAVVKNAGEWFPYIAIIMLCAGLLLHVAIMLRVKAART